MNNDELKKKLLELLKSDEEFRYAVMGLLGIADLKASVDRLTRAVNRLTRAIKAHEKRLTKVEETVSELAKIVKAHEERLTSIENRLTNVENRLTSVETVLTELRRDVRDIKVTLDRYSITLEDEANDVVQYYLRQRGVTVKTGRTYFDTEYEFDIYGVTDDGRYTVVGEAKVRASPQTVRDLVGRIGNAMARWPDRFRGRVVMVLYCMRAEPGTVEEASREGVWLIEDMEERTKPNL